MGYGRSFDMGVFGSNFGHAVTQNLPVLASQFVQPAVPNKFAAFTLGSRAADLHVPGDSIEWIVPAGRPGTASSRVPIIVNGLPSGQSCTAAAHSSDIPAPANLGRLERHFAAPTGRTTSIEVAYIGNKGTNVFAGDGNTYNINQPLIGR